ncbi:MAG: hypothetical protein ABI651_01505 [Verrucomicrobiota bacterium]
MSEQPQDLKPSTKASVPPPLPASEPPVLDALPALIAGSPPPPPPAKPTRKAWPVRQRLAFLLSLCLGLFLADAVVSFVDDSLIHFFGIHVLAVIRGILFLFALLMAIAIYGLMGVTPMIPKRLFLPVTLFNPVAGLVGIPFVIYFYGRIQQVAWALSFCQVIFGLSILYWVQGGFKFRWPLVAESQLEAPRFSWRNLSVFLLVNVFVLLPGVVIYLVFCAALAVHHFSEGFLALRPGGLTVQARKYVRDDGKAIQLFPMAHIGEPDFYRKLSESFPTNSIILMEGVTDNRNLLTNKITYKRMATSLGLAEQVNEFKPSRGEMVQADVDVDQFATNTIDFLNRVMLVHSKGVNAENVVKLMQYSPPPHFEEQLFDDLLRKRNRRLLAEIHSRLLQTENLIVPWGVAHMPEIAKEIQKSGFRLDETREYEAIQFRSVGNKRKSGLK